MKYRRVRNLPNVAAADAVLRCVYGAKLPPFDRAEIFESENKDGVLRAFQGSEARHFRVERDGGEHWVFFGGVLLLNPKDLDAASG